MPLSPRQILAIKRSTATFNLWYGSVRSGKTIASLWQLLNKISQHNNQGLILIIGLNRNTIWNNIFKPLLTEPQFKPITPHINYRQGAPSGTILGHEIQIVGASDESSWLRIQGMTVAICYGDEVTAWPLSFWNMLETRLSLPNSWFLGTCNPGSSNHYLINRIITPANNGDPDYHVEKILLKHNPFITQKVKDRYQRAFTGIFAQRMLNAEWVAAEGAIYDTWNPTTMTTHTHPPITSILGIGIDYGTTHPTAAYTLALCNDNNLYITTEFSPNPGTTRLSDHQLADKFQTWLTTLPQPPQHIYADPAAASFRQELHTRGITTHKASNQVLPGINTVHSLLTSGRLKIMDTCTKLINEIPNYRWDPQATQQGQDKPLKTHDDHVDALRYTIYSTRHKWGTTNP